MYCLQFINGFLMGLSLVMSVVKESVNFFQHERHVNHFVLYSLC